MISYLGKIIMNQTLKHEANTLKATYENTVSQVTAVIDRSVSCRQHLKVECQGSYIGERAERFWKSRSYDIMYNWGTPNGTTGCQCGLMEGWFCHFRFDIMWSLCVCVVSVNRDWGGVEHT